MFRGTTFHSAQNLLLSPITRKKESKNGTLHCFADLIMLPLLRSSSL